MEWLNAGKTEVIQLPPYSTFFSVRGKDADTPFVPSLIHYESASSYFIGCEVYDGGKIGHDLTYGKLKRQLRIRLETTTMVLVKRWLVSLFHA